MDACTRFTLSRELGQNLFVYGGSLGLDEIKQVLGRLHIGERLRATLTGFKGVSIEEFPSPVPLSTPGERVEGLLPTDLTEEVLARLDAHPRVVDGWYERVLVEVAAYGCGSSPMRFQSQAYVAGPLLRLD